MMFTAWVAHLQCAAFATRLPTAINECGRTRTHNAFATELHSAAIPIPLTHPYLVSVVGLEPTMQIARGLRPPAIPIPLTHPYSPVLESNQVDS